MDQLRNFAASNRGSVINVVYVLAFIIIIYYLASFYFAGYALDMDLVTSKMNAKTSTAGVNSVTVTIDDGKASTSRRIKAGGEYTISTWIYINDWDYRHNNPKSVFCIQDSNVTDNYLMTCTLYPNEAKLAIRAYTDTDSDSMTNKSAYDAALKSTAFPGSMENKMCDVVDIDLQRWIYVTVSMNGRIMDVYLDGKLARSCILPSTTSKIPNKSKQDILFVPFGGFGGYISGAKFSASAVTPDRIYAQYQSGPYASSSFLDYLGEKTGFVITYQGAQGLVTKDVNLNPFSWFSA